MTSEKKDFYGKEVADAIKKACSDLNVPQEQLEIEVVDTGSTGIFGLIRKKAHITAFVKQSSQQGEVKIANEPKKLTVESTDAPVAKRILAAEEQVEETATEKTHCGNCDETNSHDDNRNNVQNKNDEEEIPENVLAIIQQEFCRLLALMGYPSSVEIRSEGSSVFCRVDDQYEQILTGQDGKTLDSIQYLLRKIVARKVPNRLRLSVDVGNYREKRLEELQQKAVELAEQVKASGKTQVIAALSPSERRVVHMHLQDDKEIRSRSVGDGLFKKILIYKPGKGGKGGGRKRNNSRSRQSANSRTKSD